MIRINRVKVEIITEKSKVGFDESFDSQMNIICSEQNTSGKSSIISCIYYGLGLEEIIGGQGFNVLSSAFKSKVVSDEEELDVLESKVFLEVSNGKEDITIYRAAKMKNRHYNLMTVFDSKMDLIYDSKTKSEDMYVHSQNSATNSKGFFTFLESFLDLRLPKVPSTDDKVRKLYLQLIFSSMLIEQKRGWADLFSGMPHFGIKEPKKRVIEYLLNMDTFHNSELKHSLKAKESGISETWKKSYDDIVKELDRQSLILTGIERKPKILEDMEQSIGVKYQENDSVYSLTDYIELKKKEYQQLIKVKPKSIDNFEELKKELIEIETSIINHEEKLKKVRENLKQEEIGMDRLSNSLNLLQTDIINNQDAKKLRGLGSKEGFETFEDICPTCNQSISDTLLVSQNLSNVMSIEENIKHLKSQENLFKFAIGQKAESIEKGKKNSLSLENSLSKMYALAKVTRNDIFAIDGLVTESTIYKKVELNKTIDELEALEVYIEETIKKFQQLSSDWKKNLGSLNKLPKNKFSILDEKKLDALRDHFVSNLKAFGYRSSSNINKVMISRDTYMPIIENFDLKFDSSASDHIRRIWAFTIALVQTSNDLNGNHPGLLIFDEPGQHSIVVEDMKVFFDYLNDISSKNQVIVGITIKETETKELVLKRIKDGIKGIIVKDRAFNKYK